VKSGGREKRKKREEEGGEQREEEGEGRGERGEGRGERGEGSGRGERGERRERRERRPLPRRGKAGASESIDGGRNTQVVEAQTQVVDAETQLQHSCNTHRRQVPRARAQHRRSSAINSKCGAKGASTPAR